MAIVTTTVIFTNADELLILRRNIKITRKDYPTMTNDDIANFSRQSLSRYSRNYNYLITGSLADLPFQYYLEHPSDLDILSWHNDIHISPEDSPLPRHLTGQFYRLETCNSPAGFARIISYQNSGEWTYCGKISRLADPNNGPAFTQMLFDENHKLTSDLVIGLRFSVWPSNANEWKERERPNGWPSNELIRKIVNDGCHLVLKSHPSHLDDENEWRFSFSLAEFNLVHTWTDVQRYIYRTLRLIKSKIVEKAGGSEQTTLKTYHFKTLMFWACEAEPPWFWEEIRIETAVKELLGRMTEWVIEKRCPNYFIPSCNLFDGQFSDPKNEIHLLLSYVQNVTLHLPQYTINKSGFQFHFSTKVLLMFQMACNCMNFANPLKPEEVMSSLRYLACSPLLTEEIRWIHRAISIHLNATLGHGNGEAQRFEVQEAIICFSLAKISDIERDNILMTIRLCDNIYGSARNLGFIETKYAISHINECVESISIPNLLDRHGFALDVVIIINVLNHLFTRP